MSDPMTTDIDAANAPDDAAYTVDLVIRRDITDAIFDQRMPPGTRLSEARLGELYDVSRTVVRKALYRLASDKLVDIRPNRGAIVHQPTVADAYEVFEARRLIESAMLETSVPAMSSDDHQQLRELLAADQAAHTSHDSQQMIRASGNFHRGLAAMSDNSILCNFLDQLIGQTSLIIAMYQSHASPACSHSAHSDLIEVIERGDVAGAQHTMRKHLRETENQLDLAGATADNGLAQMLGAHASRN